ncbi:4a-hydroxytetrahydrobiopterin dehydratase [Noviherbaspirillum aridicola]|uniref:Putative pterin-4-alpha-carbinolamine dehydratase n=1 Tax=Noviherbaspirillum aridicola TaxID=2849687 RepID=A0ABQ4Q0P5_9BURK|nr:4a-hydroxytetrahydrobiopterin dehydratase [Noviherbaspirillum aridicola]GIZ50668.1 putative pterin-4-alpha-carbinolamine dehydratase [Noviherbaspirillum aridicola]
MITNEELLARKGRHLETGLDESEIKAYLAAVDGWSLQEGKLTKTFGFANYYETLAFVNAIAWPVHADDHHPELTVTYNRCVVKFDTHSVNGGRGGISENDFILAAKVDAVYRQKAQ